MEECGSQGSGWYDGRSGNAQQLHENKHSHSKFQTFHPVGGTFQIKTGKMSVVSERAEKSSSRNDLCHEAEGNGGNLWRNSTIKNDYDSKSSGF